ncbi:1435_t:CDS:2 [Ambispora gerdemannii]|uniref:1435_t:CDS:1 n=1 Tax=Ambispora gerdemannii TaxID=144530 RepID=A0A9N8V9H2_9GLOM|nr:1435_t:CDS:2 [Ambispora gerdemannii]
MASAVDHHVIIPNSTSAFNPQENQMMSADLKKPEMLVENNATEKNAPTAPKEPISSTTLMEKLKQQDPFLETPPSPGTLQNPPPPYSQWDELSLEQILQKSCDVINGHSEYLAQGGGNQKENTDMLDKMTQLESLVASLQSILSDQTFAMHDIRSQLSDIQGVLKKMQDKQETMTSEEVMKQVVTMKVLTENIIASKVIPTFELNSQTSSLAVVLQPPSRPTSRAASRQASRAPSRSVSRTVSPNRSPVISRTSSKLSSTPGSPAIRPYKVSTMNTITEGSDFNEDSDGENSVAFERMCSILSTLITEATTAVEAPVNGRKKKVRQDSNASQASRDYFEDFDWDALADDDEDACDQVEMVEPQPNLLREPRKKDRTSNHKRSRSRKEQEFEESFKTLDSSLTQVQCLITDMTDELMEEEEAVIVKDKNGMLIREIKDKNGNIIREEPLMDVQYPDPTMDLLNNPSADLADLDDFAQQCRLITRALILPFLHATHSFMSESLHSTNQSNAPKSVTGTTRTFMNLMYWTFLFTLGSLVLDAWLCEVAGRQVIRMVDMLKPGPPFKFVQNQPAYEIQDEYHQEGNAGMVNDSKKKNVKIRTGFRLKTVSWRGVEAGVGSGQRWLRNGAQGVLSLGKKSRGFLTGERWGLNKIYHRSMLSHEWGDDDVSEDSDEWEIVDFSTDEEEDESMTEESSEDDPALLLRRRITNERMKRAGHVKTIFNHIGDTNKEEKENITNIQENESSISNINNQDPISMEAPVEIVSKETIALLEQDLENHSQENSTSSAMMEEDDKENNYNHNEDDELCEEKTVQEYFNDEDVDLQIPGSFPAELTINSTTMETDESDKENVRRVRSVVLRRPKRNGPFGGSGGFWVMQTRKVRTKSSKKKSDNRPRPHSFYSLSSNNKENEFADLLKSSNTKSNPIFKKKKKSSSHKNWVRRNSI